MTALVVDGYCFETLEAYQEAKKEFESIAYIKARTNLEDIKSLIKLYNSLIDRQIFATPVGTSFLKALYDKIIAAGAVSRENLRPVPVKLVLNKQGRTKGFEQDAASGLRLRLSHSEKKRKNTLTVSILLALIICVLFGITIFGDRSPILDAELKFQNKYAGWEEELEAREKAVVEKEKELGLER